MISITRVLARTLRSTFRKASDTRGRSQSSVTFRVDEAGMRIQSRAGSVGVEYRREGSFPSESFALPLAALADFEGSKSTSVQLAGEPTGGVRVEWSDAGVPQRRVYASHGAESWLEAPRALRPVGDGTILAALNEAMSAAATSQVRYALTCVLLRGKKGEAVGTDGKQLLIVRGLGFPWTDDVLVPRTKLFDGKAFLEAPSVEMARTEDPSSFGPGHGRRGSPATRQADFRMSIRSSHERWTRRLASCSPTRMPSSWPGRFRGCRATIPSIRRSRSTRTAKSS